MIAAWMLYTIVVTLILFAAASAADYVGRATRVPTRFVWFAAMVVAVVFSARALARGTDALTSQVVAEAITRPTFVVDTANASTAMGVSPDRASRTVLVTQWSVTIRTLASTVAGLTQRIDVNVFDRWNQTLIVGCLTSTLVAFAWFAVSLQRLRRIEGTLTPVTIDNHAVLLSTNIGPALLGVVRSRIVLPRWVFDLQPAERNVILVHEREHAAAFDPALMYCALLLVALQPWNIALWLLFARLQLALEADCDGRVLRKTSDAFNYGRLLIAIYERTTTRRSLHVAFAEHRSNLEKRIRRIAGRPRFFSTRGLTSVFAAVVLASVACAASVPQRRGVVAVALRDEVTSVGVRAPKAEPVNVPPVMSQQASSVERTLPLPPAQTFMGRTVPVLPIGSPVPAKSWGRCSFFERATATSAGNLKFPNASDASDSSQAKGMFPGGCTIHGDVMVMALDSNRVLVSARDTSDAHLAVTDVFIFVLRNGTTSLTRDNWHEKVGRATLTDSVFYYARPGHPTLAFRFQTGATVRERDAQVVDVHEFMGIHSSFITWDALAQFPTAPRCVPNETPNHGERICFLVNGTQRVEFPIPSEGSAR